MSYTQKKEGFTLIELLIVISIIAILSVALIFVMNPVETLKKARDSQRVSDLSTLKSSLGVYTTSTTSPILAGTTNAGCKSGTGVGIYDLGQDRIYYSYPSNNPGVPITDLTVDGVTFDLNFGPKQVLNTTARAVDGTGWLPVNLEVLTGGAPISSYPVDPVNKITDPTALSGVAIGSTPPDYVYRYVCNETTFTYEIDTVLESNTYVNEDRKMQEDGGNNINYYEVGTNLKLLGAGTDF